MTTTHKCPGCGAAGIPHARLSCKPCWFRLPRPIRREVDAAYRVRRRDARRHLLAVGAASRWWRTNPPATVLEHTPAPFSLLASPQGCRYPECECDQDAPCGPNPPPPDPEGSPLRTAGQAGGTL